MEDKLREGEFIRRQNGIHGVQDYIYRSVKINTGLYGLDGKEIIREEEHCIGIRIENPKYYILISKVKDGL